MSKDIWHTADEKPINGLGMVVYYSKECDEELLVGYYNTEYEDFRPLDESYCEEKTVKKWCYLNDLVALENELQRTHKALDLTKDTLHWYDDNYDSVVAQETINEITALEQKDK